ncbi:hypothetical protein A6A11_07325 [Bisgaardia hudsonensis]|nr:hypothetical protein A6A11_07325 [Bisgaardia hudsonensis]
MDPVIPKKPIAESTSILNKAKNMVSAFGKKDNQHSTTQEEAVAPVSANMQETSNQNIIESENIEKPMTQNLKNPEKWAVLQMLPTKYRRIFLVLLLAIIILLIISWLKPNSDTVQSFEQKTSREIPTQFQSLDENQPMEPTILDTLNSSSKEEQSEIAQENTATSEGEKNEAEKNEAISKTHIDDRTSPQQVVNEPVQQAQTTDTAKAVTEPVVTNTQEKSPKVEETTLSNRATTVETTKSTPSKQQQQEMQKLVNKLASNTAKPVQASKSKADTVKNKEQKSTTTNNTKNSKTLTIEKGKSLMQIFRENNLNISDVNAMTKAKGANNILNSFKSGDNVKVSVNSQGRVSELTLQNGARFIRQNDGTYTLKK